MSTRFLGEPPRRTSKGLWYGTKKVSRECLWRGISYENANRMSWSSLDDCLLFAMAVKVVQSLGLASTLFTPSLSASLVSSGESLGL